MKAVNCDPFWLARWILSLRSSQTFPVRPNMVWLMWCKWGIWNTLAIHLYLVLSHFQISRRTFNTSLLDEANAFFLPWHFKVRDVKEATVSNYVQLILDSQSHKHASKIVLLDRTLFWYEGPRYCTVGGCFMDCSSCKRLHSQSIRILYTKKRVLVLFPFSLMKTWDESFAKLFYIHS